jgi:hypothetical protein
MNTLELYTPVQSAMDRLRIAAQDEQGMEVVEKVGMIAIMLVLLGAIGAVFSSGGMEVGMVVVDKLVEFIRGISA